jgi:nitrile hydratase
MSPQASSVPPRLPVGAKVHVDDRPSSGHCRTPIYLRGKSGVVVSVFGPVRDPALLAYHKPGLPMRVLYRVRFKQGDIWPDYAGPPGDTLEADLFDVWLKG